MTGPRITIGCLGVEMGLSVVMGCRVFTLCLCPWYSLFGPGHRNRLCIALEPAQLLKGDIMVSTLSFSFLLFSPLLLLCRQMLMNTFYRWIPELALVLASSDKHFILCTCHMYSTCELKRAEHSVVQHNKLHVGINRLWPFFPLACRSNAIIRSAPPVGTSFSDCSSTLVQCKATISCLRRKIWSLQIKVVYKKKAVDQSES